mmetsp:Transcript_4572/g.6868  ORF Transcript_4572/g.6868 Transcript_4572/m.6868 type:complete len:80 (+) Transcript_4572:1932-2171(+)
MLCLGFYVSFSLLSVDRHEFHISKHALNHNMLASYVLFTANVALEMIVFAPFINILENVHSACASSWKEKNEGDFLFIR